MNNNNASINLGWGGLLFIILFVLKINPGDHLDSPVTDWSWWWITAPLWAVPAILILLAATGWVIYKVLNRVAKTLDKRIAKQRRARRSIKVYRR